MVSHLVTKDEGNRTLEEEIGSGSEGPDVSERVQMVMVILRPTTAQMVLGHTGSKGSLTQWVHCDHIVII